jgi:hypothetical protein
MAEDRAVGAGEHCRHPSTSFAESGMAHGVDAPVNAVEATCGNPIADATRKNTGNEELMRRNHAMLRRRQACDRCILSRVVAFLRHIRRKATNARNSPLFIAGFRPFAAPSRRDTCRFPRRWRPNAH